MQGRGRTFRAVFWLSLLAGSALTAQAAAGCNDAPLIEVPACRPGLCTCEEDPTQATCKGFNDRPEGGKDPADATRVETSVELDAGDAADAAVDEDGGDASDGA